MTDILTAIFSTIGALAILFASIGILRMPDFYLRLSVTVKASTLGVGFLLACAAFTFSDTSVTTKAMSIVFFLILTAPVAAHMIGKTAYHTGVAIWKGTVIDELKGTQNEQAVQPPAAEQAPRPAADENSLTPPDDLKP